MTCVKPEKIEMLTELKHNLNDLMNHSCSCVRAKVVKTQTQRDALLNTIMDLETAILSLEKRLK